MPTPSWEYYYEEMAEELVAPYRAKLAKSEKSKCTQMRKTWKNCADCSASWNKEDPSSTLMELVDTTAPPEFITNGELWIGQE
jgi:hypothetical protein